jgi:hypothetical protein
MTETLTPPPVYRIINTVVAARPGVLEFLGEYTRLISGLPDETKTYYYYNRQIVSFVGQLFTDSISADDFITVFSTLIYNQLFAAWRDGMAANGLDPSKDFTQDMADKISPIADGEVSHLRGFAADIIAARPDGADEILARAGLWSNRYNDVLNMAKMETAPKDKRYKWIYGDTEHCETCAMLNGKVATAAAWSASGYRPQSPPNPRLSCGGWRCRCKLVETEDKETEGGIPS